jgi:hypothetical protein
MYLGIFRKIARKPAPLRGVAQFCASEVSNSGVTPCRFLGYIFRNRTYTYFVTQAGELVVSMGDKVLVEEFGVWR